MKRTFLKYLLPVLVAAFTASAGSVGLLQAGNAPVKNPAAPQPHFAAVTAPEPAAPASLQRAADRVLRTSALLTLGGVKPFSSVGRSDGPGPQFNPVTDLEWLIESAEITNPDLLFLPGRFFAGDPDSGMITIASKSAIMRLLKDKTAMGILEKYKDAIPYALPRDTAGWIELYSRAVEADGYHYKGPFWANLVVGISLGYPPLEAEAYCKNLENDDAPYRLITAGHPGFRLGGYARFTELETERDVYYLAAARALAKNYDRLVAAGRTPLGLFNDPAPLKQGLPLFSPGLLLP